MDTRIPGYRNFFFFLLLLLLLLLLLYSSSSSSTTGDGDTATDYFCVSTLLTISAAVWKTNKRTDEAGLFFCFFFSYRPRCWWAEVMGLKDKDKMLVGGGVSYSLSRD